jgi:hypothetical protein
MKTLAQCDSDYYYVSINGDPDRVLKWHLTDSELPKRVNKLIKYVENAYTDMIARIDTIGMSPGTYDYIEKKEREVLAEFDRTFGDGASNTLFPNSKPFAKAINTKRPLVIDALDYLRFEISKFGMEVEKYVV